MEVFQRCYFHYQESSPWRLRQQELQKRWTCARPQPRRQPYSQSPLWERQTKPVRPSLIDVLSQSSAPKLFIVQSYLRIKRSKFTCFSNSPFNNGQTNRHLAKKFSFIFVCLNLYKTLYQLHRSFSVEWDCVMIMNNKMWRKCNDSVAACFKSISQLSSWLNEENKIISGSRFKAETFCIRKSANHYPEASATFLDSRFGRGAAVLTLVCPQRAVAQGRQEVCDVVTASNRHSSPPAVGQSVEVKRISQIVEPRSVLRDAFLPGRDDAATGKQQQKKQHLDRSHVCVSTDQSFTCLAPFSPHPNSLSLVTRWGGWRSDDHLTPMCNLLYHST